MSTKLLSDFEAWLLRRGRDELTATSYRGCVRRALEYSDPTEVLLGRYAPLTKRHYCAALRAWAKFRQDGAMLARLDDIRLPPAQPKEPRLPFDEEAWHRLLDAIEGDAEMDAVRRSSLAIIAVRGIRIGDVVRLKKTEIQSGVRTGVLPFDGKRGRRYRFAAISIKPHLEALLAEPWRGRTHLRELIVGPGQNQQRQAARALRRELAKIAERLGFEAGEVHPHRFRPTAAQAFLREIKGDPEAVLKVKDWMEWANLNTAMHYMHADRSKELADVEQRMVARRRGKQ